MNTPIDPRDVRQCAYDAIVEKMNDPWLSDILDYRQDDHIAEGALGALDQEGIGLYDTRVNVVVLAGAIQHVIDECTTGDLYALVDGEWLRRHMLGMLNGSDPVEAPHHAVYDTRVNVVIDRAELNRMTAQARTVYASNGDAGWYRSGLRDLDASLHRSLLHGQGIHNRETHVVVPIAELKRLRDVFRDDSYSSIDVANECEAFLRSLLPTESEAS